MAFFGRQRDINLFTTVNRELLGDIVTQECAFYKYRLDQTTINIYGESAEDKYYDGPTLFNCLIERQNQTNPIDDMGLPDFEWTLQYNEYLADPSNPTFYTPVELRMQAVLNIMFKMPQFHVC